MLWVAATDVLLELFVILLGDVCAAGIHSSAFLFIDGKLDDLFVQTPSFLRVGQASALPHFEGNKITIIILKLQIRNYTNYFYY